MQKHSQKYSNWWKIWSLFRFLFGEDDAQKNFAFLIARGVFTFFDLRAFAAFVLWHSKCLSRSCADFNIEERILNCLIHFQKLRVHCIERK